LVNKGMNPTLRGIPFTTASGTDYFYDDCTGLVYPCPPGLNAILRSDLSPFPSAGENSGKWETFINERHRAYGAFFPIIRPSGPPPQVTASDIARTLNQQGFRQLILTLTGACNLRCRYCINSEAYSYDCQLADKHMEFSVARRAIDYYLENLERIRRKDPGRRAAVTFYGGEPLLNFTVLEKSVRYIREQGVRDIIFNVSTNGTLLNEKISDFLVENNFGIWVSLDGPQREHDRNRVFRLGRGSFEVVFTNIQRFWERYPHYRLLGFLVTYDWATNLMALLEFFDSRSEFRHAMFMFNTVSPYFTDYYDRFSPTDQQRFLDRATKLKELLRLKFTETSPVLNFFVSAPYRIFLMRRLLLPPGRPEIAATGACLPGEKICVLPDGRFQPCERVPGFLEIGDIERGLDFEAISEVVNTYNHTITSQCSTCPIQRLCHCCLSHFWSGKEITKPWKSFCSDQVAWSREVLQETYSLLEEVSEFYGHVMNLYHRHYHHWEFLSVHC
jgi:uncharacterized protein